MRGESFTICLPASPAAFLPAASRPACSLPSRRPVAAWHAAAASDKNSPALTLLCSLK
jgi:hypothetical protein